MTLKQQRFCEEYIKCGNATQAYKIAYPTVKNDDVARKNGSRLLTNADIKEYIEQKNREISNSNIADMQEIKEFWTSILRDNREKSTDRLKASEFIAKTNGAFIDKVQLESDNILTININGEFDEC